MLTAVLGFGASPAAAQDEAPPTTRIHGTALPAGYVDGDELDSVMVVLLARDGDVIEDVDSASTQPDGSYELNAPAGNYLLMAVSGPYGDNAFPTFYPGADFIDDAETVEVTGAEPDVELNMTLAAAAGPGGARGIVRVDDEDDNTADGAPIAGATVTLSDDGGDTIAATVETDAAGKWSAKVPAGFYDVIVTAPNMNENGLYGYDVQPGVWNEAVSTELAYGPAQLTGRVLAGGAPVADVEVLVYPPGGRSAENPDGYSPTLVPVDADGTFSFETDEYGPSRVTAWAPGYEEQSIDFEAKRGTAVTVQFDLKPWVESQPDGPQHGGGFVPAPPAPPAPAPAAPAAPTITGLPAPKGKSATPLSVNSGGQLVGLSLSCPAGQACGSAGLSYQPPAVKKKGKKTKPKPVEVTTVKNGKLVLTKKGKSLLKSAGKKGLTVELQVRDAAGNVVSTRKVKLKAEPKKSSAKKK